MTRMTGHSGTSLTDGLLGSSRTYLMILCRPMILASQAKCPRWMASDQEVAHAGAPEAGGLQAEGSLLAGQMGGRCDANAGQKHGRPRWPAGS